MAWGPLTAASTVHGQDAYGPDALFVSAATQSERSARDAEKRLPPQPPKVGQIWVRRAAIAWAKDPDAFLVAAHEGGVLYAYCDPSPLPSR